jgi:hypothetical protein
MVEIFNVISRLCNELVRKHLLNRLPDMCNKGHPSGGDGATHTWLKSRATYSITPLESRIVALRLDSSEEGIGVT